MKMKNKTFLAALILGLIIGLGSVSSFAGNTFNTDGDNLDYRAWSLYMTAANSMATPEIDPEIDIEAEREAQRAFAMYMMSTDRWGNNY